jgi:hypothetical protein
MKTTLLPSLRLAGLLLGTWAAGHAQTVTHLYHAGENDAGAANSAALAALTIDFTGPTNLSRLSTAGTYTSSTLAPGSTLAFSLDGTGGFSAAAPDTTLVSSSSFVMEVWFNTASLTGARALFYNGDTGGSGIGLFRDGNHLAILGGGAIFQSGPTVLSTNTWYHAALVNDSNAGSVALYLNGGLEFSTGNGFNAPITGGLSLGSNYGNGDRFTGALDEARVFTFAPGTFTTSMLSYSAVPEPSTYAAILGGLALAGVVVVRRRRVQA